MSSNSTVTSSNIESSDTTPTTESDVQSDNTISKVQAEAPSESTSSPPSPPEETSSTSDNQSSSPPPPDSSSESKKESKKESSSSDSDSDSSPPPPTENDDDKSSPPPTKQHQSSPPPPEKSSSTSPPPPPPTTETNTPPAPVVPNHHPPPPPSPPAPTVPVVGEGNAPPVGLVPPNVVLAPPQMPGTVPSGQSNLTSAGPPGPGSPSPSSPATHNHQQIQHLVIAGAVAGSVFFLIMVLMCVLCCKLKKRNSKKHDLQDPYWQYTYGPTGGKNQHTVNIPPPQSSMTGGGPIAGGVYGWSTPNTTPGGAMSNWSTTQQGGGVPQPVPPPPNGMSTSSTGEMMTNSDGTTTGTSTTSLGYLSKSAFTYDELAAATNGFSQMNMLGQGGFGFVHKGVLPNGKEVAIKSLKSGSGQGEREFQAEVEIISRVHHRHLVSLVGYCIAGSKRMLVYEFVPNDTLEHHLHKKSGPPLSFSIRVRIALGSAKGLAYLHEDCHPRIIHRDIKASNILLDGTFEAQVADFGLAKLTEDTNTHVSTRVMGTFGYLAPEYAASGKLSEKSDVFSFGVMLLELITGRRPVDPDMKYMEDSLVDWARPLLSKAVDDGNYDELADPKLMGNYNNQEMAHMVACAAACIRHSAKKRPKMSQVVRALEGDMALDDLKEMALKKQAADSSSGSDDVYDTRAYSADLKKFRQMAFGSLEFTGVQSSTGSSSSNYK